MLSALGVGVSSMIWMTALMRGMVDQMVEDSIDNLSGHVQIHAPGFRDDPSVSNSMSPPSTDLLDVLNSDDIIAWSTRLRLPAMLSSERQTLPVTIVGIEPARERGLSFIMDARMSGRMLTSPDDHAIILGARMVDKLETSPGKRIVMMTQDIDNQLADRGFRIAGVFDADTGSLETSYAFVGIDTLRAMLGCRDCVSEVSMRTHHYLGLDPLRKQLQSVSAQNEVLTWMELDPYAEAMLASANGYILVLLSVIFISLSFGLVNTLVMAIFERSREIALVHALGLSPSSIALMILLEASFLIATGMGIGNIIAYFSLLSVQDGIDLSIVSEGLDMFGMSSTLKPSILLTDIIMANLLVIILGLLACLLPAWRAARQAPAAALSRGEA